MGLAVVIFGAIAGLLSLAGGRTYTREDDVLDAIGIFGLILVVAGAFWVVMEVL